jgi:hypothetical protein
MNKFRNHLFVNQLAGVLIIWLATSMTSRAQASDATDESWTSTNQNSTANANPYRTTESHVKSGNRTLDKKTVEVRGPDGTYQLSLLSKLTRIWLGNRENTAHNSSLGICAEGRLAIPKCRCRFDAV